MTSPPGGEWGGGDSRVEGMKPVVEFHKPYCNGNIHRKDFAEKTGPERVHTSGAGRHALKNSGLNLWPITSNKQIATGCECRTIQTVAGEQATKKS